MSKTDKTQSVVQTKISPTPTKPESTGAALSRLSGDSKSSTPATSTASSSAAKSLDRPTSKALNVAPSKIAERSRSLPAKDASESLDIDFSPESDDDLGASVAQAYGQSDREIRRPVGPPPERSESVSTDSEGRQVTRVELVYPDGTTEVTETVDLGGGSSQTTQTTTAELDGDIEDFLPHDQRPSTDTLPPEEGERGPVVSTHQTVTVTSVGEDGRPRTVTVGESQNFQQHIELSEPDSISGPTVRLSLDPELDGVTLDPANSGQTISYTSGTRLGPDGQEQAYENYSDVKQVAGTNQSGEEVVVRLGNQYQSVNGQPVFVEHFEEGINLIDSQDPTAVNAFSQNAAFRPDVQERIESIGGNISIRTSTIETFDENGQSNVSEVTQFGDYQRPDLPGRSLTVTANDNQLFITDSLRTSSPDGSLTTREQTVLDGSPYLRDSISIRRNDGTFESEVTETLNGVVQSESRTVGHHVPATSVEAGADPQFWDQFLENVGTDPIFAVETETTRYNEDGSVASREDIAVYNSGQNQLSQVESTENGAVSQGTLLLQDGEPPVQGQFDGTGVSVDGQGEVRSDGDVVGNVFDQVTGIDPDLLTDRENRQLIRGALGVNLLPRILGNSSPSTRFLPVLGTLTGAVNLVNDLSQGNLDGAVRDVGGLAIPLAGTIRGLGLAQVSTGAGARLAQRLPALAAVANSYIGIQELRDGELAEGGASIASAVGAGILLFGATNPVGWVLFAGGSLVHLGLEIFGDDPPPESRLTLPT